MNTVKLPTPEEREQVVKEMALHAEELSKEHNTKVHPLLFVDIEKGEFVKGYLKEPNLMTKLMILDKGVMSALSSCAGVLPLYVIESESDSRLYRESSNPADHPHYLGAANYLMNLVQTSQDQMKKK